MPTKPPEGKSPPNPPEGGLMKSIIMEETSDNKKAHQTSRGEALKK